MIKKNMVYVFCVAMLIYFASLSVYLISSFYLSDSRVFLITRILMVCSLCVFFLIELNIKKIAENEEVTQSKIDRFSRFDVFRKVCTVLCIGVLVVLLIRDVIC
mgnify:CR=1 FL=1